MAQHLLESEREQLMNPLRGKPLKVHRPGVGYTSSLALVALAMVLLPVVYIAMIVAAAAGVFWYATNAGPAIFSGAQHIHGRAVLLLVVAYVGPLVAGAILVLFMLKPLFARQAKPVVAIALQRQQEPVLFEFVDRVALLVGAPTPKEICIDWDVNASAGFRRGLLSFLGSDLRLTIGVPLLASLTVGQVAGILAHEFGHFNQGTAMRLSYVIRSINGWFFRLVYERDTWDEWVSGVAQSESHWSINLVGALAMLAIWLSRRVLWVLMLVGGVISCLLLRQMEYDADRCQVQLAGSREFTTTFDRIVLLGACSHGAHTTLQQTWRARRLCDDICALISRMDEALPADIRHRIRDSVQREKTGLFDSHPSARDRIARASRKSDPGLYHNEQSATMLLSNFTAASRLVTLDLYSQALGASFDPSQLVPSDDYLKRNNQQSRNNQVLLTFFQALLHPLRPVFPELRKSEQLNSGQAGERLLELRSTMEERIKAARSAHRTWQVQHKRMMDLVRIRALRQAGVTRLNVSELGMRDCEDGTIARAMEQTQAKIGQLRQQVDVALVPAMERITIAAGLLGKSPAGGENCDVRNARGSASIGSIAAAIGALRSAWPAVQALHEQLLAMGAVTGVAKDGSSGVSLDAVRAAAAQTHARLTEAHRLLQGTPAPYDTEDGKATSIACFALARLPVATAQAEVGRAAETFLEAVYGLYMQTMGDLGERAEQLERSMGLEQFAAASDPGKEA